ncbi:arylsulfatase [Aureibaculum algae]|uniref:Arylsulfatase n=1 Tax=Aureibaculum algae TaxID=2584122 RepID=A0A5B7TVP6_9FLAO|nr:arylsulfatase [Aureibaculum algae]QCX40328.1 arylsulfatase [Aureibaculum algae]
MTKLTLSKISILFIFLVHITTNNIFSQQKTNVVIVISDDQGYGDIAALGNPYLHTPNLDKLHDKSTCFTNFHVSPTCSPTRGALLTGHYSNRTGAWHTIAGRSIMYADEVTMADIFKSNGYATGLFGKWHLGDNYPYRPQDRGFEEVITHGGGGVQQQSDYWDNDYFDDTYLKNGKPTKFEGYCTDIWFDNAKKFMLDKQKAGKPFLCYISTNAAHSPLFVADKYTQRYKDNPKIPNAAFYGMIENIDENIGKLKDFLTSNHLEENTLLIFLTDNGGADGMSFKNGELVKGYNAGMSGRKGSPLEGGHRVPLFMQYKGGQLKKVNEIEALTAHIDLLPTLIDLLHLKKPKSAHFDGVSLIPLLNGNQKNFENRIIVTDSQREEVAQKWQMSATMMGDWRLIDGDKLYNINSDPAQKTNVATQFPEIKQQLRTGYDTWWKSLQPALKKTAYIPICSKESPKTTLFIHDAHPDDEKQEMPWNQILQREGVVYNGYHTIEILEDATYTFALARWPEEIPAKITEGITKREAIPNTTVFEFPAAAALPIVNAGILIGNQQKELKVDATMKKASISIKLKKGKYKFKSWFETIDGKQFNANYVYVTKQ